MELPDSQCFLHGRWKMRGRAGRGGGGRRLGQLERIVVPMRKRLGHTAIRPIQFAFGMGDCDPAVAGMVVITGIVREIMARPGVLPSRRFPGLSVNVELRHEFAAPLTKTIEPGSRRPAGSPVSISFFRKGRGRAEPRAGPHPSALRQAKPARSQVSARVRLPAQRFVPDSPLERDGFEPSVPHRSAPVSEQPARPPMTAGRSRFRNRELKVRIHLPPAGSQSRT